MEKSKKVNAVLKKLIFAKARRDTKIKEMFIPAGTYLRLYKLQKERNEDLQLVYLNKVHLVDPIDYDLPYNATKHLKKKEKIFAQGLGVV